ncbi:MAG: ABC transporter ATP-binding protein [Nitrososphaerota archaeon]
MEKLLIIENLKTYYQTLSGIIKAVDNVTLSLHKGEFLGIVGESGSGKSTLGLSILKLIPPPGKIIDGRIILNEINIIELSEKEMQEIRGKKIGMVFQDPTTSLNPLQKVGEQLIETLIFHEKISKKEAKEKAESLFEKVGIPKERFNDYPHQLSGGMRQRVMIAIAISLNPDLIIADEPTTALDVIVQAHILDLLKNLMETYNLSIILITHDLSIVLERCHKVAVMYAGNIVEYTNTYEIYEKPFHPYTIGLLQSIPNIKLDEQRINFIPGNPPDLINLPKGCRFFPRCVKRMEKCKEYNPELIEVDKEHFVRCFLYE